MKEFFPVYGVSFLILAIPGFVLNYTLYGIIAGIVIPPIIAICMTSWQNYKWDKNKQDLSNKLKENK